MTMTYLGMEIRAGILVGLLRDEAGALREVQVASTPEATREFFERELVAKALADVATAEAARAAAEAEMVSVKSGFQVVMAMPTLKAALERDLGGPIQDFAQAVAAALNAGEIARLEAQKAETEARLAQLKGGTP